MLLFCFSKVFFFWKMTSLPHFSSVVLRMCMAVLVLAGSLFYPRWQKEGGEAQLARDAGGYYWYLPSIFIYKDLKGQGFKDSILQQFVCSWKA